MCIKDLRITGPRANIHMHKDILFTTEYNLLTNLNIYSKSNVIITLVVS